MNSFYSGGFSSYQNSPVPQAQLNPPAQPQLNPFIPVENPPEPSFSHWDAPTSIRSISTHDESLSYKFWTHLANSASHDHVLYDKWCWWEGAEELLLVEVLETKLQVQRMSNIPNLKKPVHLMKLGAFPDPENGLWVGRSRVEMTIPYDRIKMFREICNVIVTNQYQQPLQPQSVYEPQRKIELESKDKQMFLLIFVSF